MIAEEFTQDLRERILHDAKNHLKQTIEPEIQKMECKQCGMQSYTVEHFTDEDDESLTAHVKCSNCGFEEKVVIHLLQDDLNKGLDDVKGALESFERTIEDFNRKLN